MLSLVRKKIQNYKDFISNIFAFGLYIVIQQLFLLPFLSLRISTQDFANVILFITVLNIISIVLGTELGNTLIIKRSVDNQLYTLILKKVLLILVIPLAITTFIIFKNVLISIIIILTLYIASIKQYLNGYLRLNNKFNWLFYSNIFYALGVLVGVSLLSVSKNPYIPFLLGEFASLVYILFKMKKIGFHFEYEYRNGNVFNTDDFKSYKTLALSSLLLNGLSYLDRLIISPILGINNLAIYYGASSTSKILLLLINPINSVLITRFNVRNNFKSFKKILTIILTVFVCSSIISVVASFLGILILYPLYYQEAIKIILPVGLSSGLTITTLIFKTIIVATSGTEGIFKVNIVYGIIFIFSAIILSFLLGIQGFAWATFFSRGIQLVQYGLLYRKELT